MRSSFFANKLLSARGISMRRKKFQANNNSIQA